MGRIHVGTSGWSYAHWKGPFYPESLPAGEMLAAYAARLASVEANGFFYGLPPPGAVARWHDRTPAGFVFAVKASRYLTHIKKLTDPAEPVARLLEATAGLGPKLGPVLLQLPPRWKPDAARLDAALAAFPPGQRLAVEPRDPRWVEDAAVDRVLRRHGAAFCVYELAGYHAPWRLTADFGYVRLHGPGPGRYQGRYDMDRLRAVADRLRRWRDQGADAYCYFDNDEHGFAAQNAVELRALLEA
ncbi:MAG: DUF72 domain-containing protein [Thermodesulfobacteriota bacterium]